MSGSTTRTRVVPYAVLYGAVIAIDAVIALWLWNDRGWTVAGTLLFCRYSARVSFLFFTAVFVVRPLVELWPLPIFRAGLRRRRHLGLAFALAHSIHVLGIAAYFSLSHSALGADNLIPLITLLIIALLAATSNNLAVRLLGKAWKILHRTGVYVIFLTFSAAYTSYIILGGTGGPVVDGVAGVAPATYIQLLTIAILALVVRGFAFSKKTWLAAGKRRLA